MPPESYATVANYTAPMNNAQELVSDSASCVRFQVTKVYLTATNPYFEIEHFKQLNEWIAAISLFLKITFHSGQGDIFLGILSIFPVITAEKSCMWEVPFLLNDVINAV